MRTQRSDEYFHRNGQGWPIPGRPESLERELLKTPTEAMRMYTHFHMRRQMEIMP